MTMLEIDVKIANGEWHRYLQNPVRHAKIHRIGLLPQGIENGGPAFEMLARTPDGGTVLLETTWALIRTALKALDAGWPDGLHHVSELAPTPPAPEQPPGVAVFTAAWLASLAVHASHAEVDRVEEVPGEPASVRIVSRTGKRLLVTVTEEA